LWLGFIRALKRRLGHYASPEGLAGGEAASPQVQRRLTGAPKIAAMKTVQERLEDAMREIGTLLVAFAPLDAALADQPGQGGRLLQFMIFGVLLFAGSVLLERRRSHVK
jgi:hypothetical protein